jgi:hypothetical protein
MVVDPPHLTPRSLGTIDFFAADTPSGRLDASPPRVCPLFPTGARRIPLTRVA